MSEDQREPERSPAEQATARPSGTPAEAQFPYVATEGLQPAASTPPRLRRRRPARPPGRRRPAALAILAALFGLAAAAAYLSWGPAPVLGSRSPAAASQVVRAYLDALARADAATARELALTPPSDPSLLTDAALARATAVSQIEVEPPLGPGRVPASYLLDGRPVDAVFELTLQGDRWRVNRVAAALDLSGLAVEVTVDGEPPASAVPSLFPGRHRIEAVSPRYELTDAVVDLRHPFEQPEPPGRLELSPAGRAEVIAAAERQLADCLRQPDLDPPDCGFAVVPPDGTPLDESTVTWSARGPADLSDLELRLDHAGSATADLDLTVRGDVRGVDGSRWRGEIQLTRLRADLTEPVVQVQFG